MIEMRSRGKRAAAVAVDRALAVAAPLLVRRGTPGGRARRPRVLVVRCDHIGDAAMATAVLEPLRRALDPERLDVLAGPWGAPVFREHPLVDGVIEYAAPWWLAVRGAGPRTRVAAWARMPGVVRRLRGRRYDVGLDLRGDLRQIVAFLALGGCRERIAPDRTGGRRLLTAASPFRDDEHEVLAGLRVAALVGAIAPDGGRLSPPVVGAPDPVIAAELARVAGPGGVVALATRGSAPGKSWSDDAARAFVREATSTLGVGIAFVGGPTDRAHGDAIAAAAPDAVVNLAGRCDIAGSMSVLRAVDAVVCVDSGPMHLAALVGTPVVALFGPTPPERYGPWSSRGVVVRAIGCSCRWQHCARTGGGDSACLHALSLDDVLDALRSMLTSRPPTAVGCGRPLARPLPPSREPTVTGAS